MPQRNDRKISPLTDALTNVVFAIKDYKLFRQVKNLQGQIESRHRIESLFEELNSLTDLAINQGFSIGIKGMTAHRRLSNLLSQHFRHSLPDQYQKSFYNLQVSCRSKLLQHLDILTMTDPAIMQQKSLDSDIKRIVRLFKGCLNNDVKKRLFDFSLNIHAPEWFSRDLISMSAELSQKQ